MSNRDRSFQWTAAGEASRVAAGIAMTEVAEAFLDFGRTERLLRPGTLAAIDGTATTGRVIRILCEPHHMPGHYTVIAVAVIGGSKE